MFEPLDGPSIQDVLSVGTGAVVEAKIGVSALTDRKVVTIQPAGKIFVLFASDAVPTVSDVTTKGFEQYKDSIQTYEAGERQKLYLVSASGTINVKIAERA